MVNVTVSIVAYNTSLEILSKCVDSIIDRNIVWNGIFIDHSPDSRYKSLFENREQWQYFMRGHVNDGFGGGNNFAMSQAKKSDYILLVNPDLYLEENSISDMLTFARSKPNLGIFTGKITYPNGSLQRLNKKNPTVYGLMGRRFPFLQKISIITKAVKEYEMSDMNYESEMDIEFISGCWMLIPYHVWYEVKGFDPRFFLYFEDADLTRRIKNLGYRTLYAPSARAIHEYQRGSHKSFKLFILFIRSMIQYFTKWGWQWK